MADEKIPTDQKKDISSEKLKNFVNFVREFKNETDRASVVLGAAKLDYVLYQVISKYLLPNANSKDDLFESDGPLSSFSAKINLAYRLGLIDKSFARALHLVRRIRNSFAHEVSGCSLDSDSHRDRIKELIAPFEKTRMFKSVKEIFFSDKDSVRSDFYTILGIMVIRLVNLHDELMPVKDNNALSPIIEELK